MAFYKVKVIVEEIYIIETDAAVDNPRAAEFLAGSPHFSTLVDKNEITSHAELIENPLDHSNEEKTPLDKDYGDLFSMKNFSKRVDNGGFSDYDGHGYYADKKYQYHQILTVDSLDKRYSHVIWYNK